MAATVEAIRNLPARRRLANTARCISTLLFYLGLVLIPFDNLPFAPSEGWATVAPMVFFAYVCFNLPALAEVRFNGKIALAALLVATLQCGNILIRGITMSALIDTLFTFTLGLFLYFAFIIRYEQQGASFDKDATVLYRAYIVAFAYGLVWLFAQNFSADLFQWFRSIERRHYDRIPFSFTEPSFISMHVYGMLFLFTYFVSDKRLARKMIILGFAFVLMSIIFRSSARSVVDIVVFLLLLLARTTLKDRAHSARNLLMWCALLGLCLVAIASSSRIQAILLGGYNEDGSMASRFFRMQCMLYGFLDDPLAVLFGYGPGNMIVPFQQGYEQAVALYTNSYTTEVSYLGNVDAIDNMFCMPIRLISDFGLLVTIAITAALIYLAKKRGVDPCVVLMTMWLYVQSDSYAFYALPVLLFLYRSYDAKTMGLSYFDLFGLFALRKKGSVLASSREAVSSRG